MAPKVKVKTLRKARSTARKEKKRETTARPKEEKPVPKDNATEKESPMFHPIQLRLDTSTHSDDGFLTLILEKARERTDKLVKAKDNTTPQRVSHETNNYA